MELKLRNDLHLSRKIWHASGISFIAYLIAILPQRDALFYLAICGLVFIPFDLLRLKRPDLNHRLVRSFKLIIRIEEVGTLTGTSFLIVGTFLCVLLYPKMVAVLAMLLLAFGDPISSLFGVLFGKDKIWGRKSLQGSLACFAMCTIVCAIYFLANNLMVERVIIVSILGGLAGALSELVQFRKLDDNLTIPVIAGLGLHILFVVFGGYG